MNFLKKGPDLKLSEIKVPGFLQDVYYDLKDRHLLPIVALLVVAIVAVPIALSQSGSDAPESSEAAGTSAATSSAAGQSAQLVAKSAPRLREYRRRLAYRQAEDPFQQQYDSPEPAGGGTEGEPAGAPSESGSSESSESPEFSPAPEPAAPETGGGPSDTPGKLTYFSYAIDVRISTGSAEEGGKKVTVRRNLPELTMLPSRETPAIVYMGSTKDGKKAVVTVSSDVEAIFGDAKCVLGSETCQLLAMEPGLPETFVYGGSGRSFKIELLKIHLVESDKLNRAPLGKPKQGKPDKGNG
jgi:hypothetical protein